MANLTLDRDELHSAIYKSTATEKLYAWATTLTRHPLNLDTIGIKDVGELALPIQIQVVNPEK